MRITSLGAAACFTLAMGLTAPDPLFAAEDASRLGKELTAVGADPAASKDGTIPAYIGKSEMTPGWSYGKLRGDYWAHKDDKVLFSIDASNVAKYQDRLSAGQVALINSAKGYRMDVYPTRRSCTVPDFVAENTKKNVTTARLNSSKTAIEEAALPGYPFPIPDAGIEVMLNQKFRYRGVAIDFPQVNTTLSPRKGSTDWVKAPTDFTYFMAWGAKGSMQASSLGGVERQVYVTYIGPPALAGQSFAITDYFDKASETFYYFPGQRRVRRMPAYTYDAPQIGWENQYLMDEPNMWTGQFDRFDWKIVGKKELFVPYNVFAAYDFKGKLEDFTKPAFLNPDRLRYELHRVWVIEATVKQGTRHVSPKRRLYIDEDSWNIVVSEDYDAQGNLWKTREGQIIPIWELGGACDVSAFVQYNLVEGRYLWDAHSVGSGKDIRWQVAPSGPRHSPNFYTADNLRAISDR